MTARLLVVGSLNYDLIFRHPRLPRAGESLVGAELYESCGGKGANQAVAAARAARCLGRELEVAFAGAIGDDEIGVKQRLALVEDGIDTAGLQVFAGVRTGTSAVWVEKDTGQNRILSHRGANELFLPEHIASLPVEESRLVLMPNEIPAATLAAVARRALGAGVQVLWNPAPFVAGEQPAIPLGDTRFLTPNEVEAEALLGHRLEAERAEQAAEELVARGANGVVITLGALGVVLIDEGPAVRVPAPSVEVVDTTGAGDAWNGAFAAALATGSSSLEAARFAVRYASESVRHAGTQTALPTHLS